jgi:hypothetical protein
MNDRELLDVLIVVYEKFVDNPNDFQNLDRISRLYKGYGRISSVNRHLKSQPISNILSTGASFLFEIWMNIDEKPDTEIYQCAEEILSNLKDLKNTL